MDLTPGQWSKLVELGQKMRAWSTASPDGLHDLCMVMDDTLGEEDPDYYLKEPFRVFVKAERTPLYRAILDLNFPKRREAAVVTIEEIKAAVLARAERAVGRPMDEWPGMPDLSSR